MAHVLALAAQPRRRTPQGDASTVRPVFARGRVERYRPHIQARAEALLGAVATAGQMDLVTDFARPLPFAVVTSVLGVPEERHPWLAERMHALDVGFARQQDPNAVIAASGAISEMLDYFDELLDVRGRFPEDDLMSMLAANPPAHSEGRADLLANCVFFINAGHITTTGLIAGGFQLLLEHPESLARLRHDPDLVTEAVEEMLRMVSPVSVGLRRPRSDIEIDGYQLDDGQQRVVFPAGVNRDPDVFHDPDVFDLHRASNPHLAFSAGAHFCLGAPLARLHGQIATESCSSDFPTSTWLAAPNGLDPSHSASPRISPSPGDPLTNPGPHVRSPAGPGDQKSKRRNRVS